jgi:hypothetical protein
VTLNTFGQSHIYYSRHGRTPTADSTVFQDPITLLRSDTLCVFVIDESGYIGEMDTFIYRIDLPPSPRFIVITDSIIAGSTVTFDGTGTTDNETPLGKLKFRWDFNGDGAYEVAFGPHPVEKFTYKVPGVYTVVLEVMDERNRISTVKKKVRVYQQCPQGMTPVLDKNGKGFCIDVYEWPNAVKTPPQTGLSWVEAKMYCLDAGKRLCTPDEWESACKGESNQFYPYGQQYDKTRCPTEGARVYASGSFKNCGEGFGVKDMVGNVWEWVDAKNGDYPFMMGGSYKIGKNAHCGLKSEGTVATQSDDIGLRCCK